MVFWTIVVLSAAAILAGIVSKFYAYYVWDDSYMFSRYADNILRYGSIVWNRGGEPTYGLTSLLYLAVVIPVRLIFPGNPSLTGAVSSLLCGTAFIALLLMTIRRFYARNAADARALIALALMALAFAADHISAHFMSGMDTMFALFYVTGFIWLIKRYEKLGTTPSAIVAGIVGGMAFFARPDLLLYSFVVPAAMFVFGGDGRARRSALIIVGIVALAVGAQMLLAYLYFGTPLPLPFYAKSTDLYGTFIQTQYRTTAYQQFKSFGLSYAPLFIAIIAAAGIAPRRWWELMTASERGLLLASVLFGAYYYFGVLQIMPFHARFYHPMLPALVLIACRSWSVFRQPVRPNRALYIRMAVVAAGIIAVLPETAMNFIDGTRSVRTDFRMNEREHNYLDFDILSIYRKFLGDGFLFRLEQFSALPDDLRMATTEVGILSALNPNKTVIDLAGLNQREFALHPFSADTLFTKFHPDLIYLPHPHYQRMIEGILNHPSFAANYDYYRGSEIDALMGIAIRRDSRYYAQMTGITKERMAYLRQQEAAGGSKK